MSSPSGLIDDDDLGRHLRSSHVAPGFWKADIVYVLLVEDDDVDANLIELYAAGLSDPQVVIERAVSTSEARTLLADWTFDLCILDFWLGCESSLRLLAELEGCQVAVPTIMLTSLSTPDIDGMCRRAGASLFIGKEGLGPASLQAAILAALRATAMKPATAIDASGRERPRPDTRQTIAAPTSACTLGFGVAETPEDAMVRVLTGMPGAFGAAAGRGRDGALTPGPSSLGDADVDRADVDLSGGSRPSSTDRRRDSLLAGLLDMTETVRFGLFEKALTTRRPGVRIQTGTRIEDAGDFIASALALARGVFDERDQRVSLNRPEGAVAIPGDPAAVLFMMFELVLRASQQSASNSHVGISLDAETSALHVSFVSDRSTHANAHALAFGPLFLKVLGDRRGAVHTVSGDDGRLRLDCRLEADVTADAAGCAGHGIVARNPSGWTPPIRAPHHHPPDAG